MRLPGLLLVSCAAVLAALSCGGSSTGGGGGTSGYCGRAKAFLEGCGFAKFANGPHYHCAEPTEPLTRCFYDCQLAWSCADLVASVCNQELAKLQACIDTCNTPIACGDGTQYSPSQACDGTPDCGNGADEASCATFTCGSGETISASWECDGSSDCQDGSDEHAGCAVETLFACGDGQSIPRDGVCDGTADCANGADEPAECQTTSTEAVCADLGK